MVEIIEPEKGKHKLEILIKTYGKRWSRARAERNVDDLLENYNIAKGISIAGSNIYGSEYGDHLISLFNKVISKEMVERGV